MTPFKAITASAAPLLRDNVDTDAIIPSREIRSVSKKGLADGLFAGWRYHDVRSRAPDPAFVLNRPEFARAQILVAGANFGCGSSREHAVWALMEYGFQAIVAESFNPIFYGNCVTNGVLPAVVERAALVAIADALEGSATPLLTVDLVAQTVSLPDRREWPFSIAPRNRHTLLKGTDPIAETMQFLTEIQEFRSADARRRPWIYTSVQR